MPQDKYGEKITWKQFFQRWKRGIEGITPLQQAEIMFKNTWLMVIGIIAGLVVSIIAYKTLWWLGIILFAALINTLIQQLGNYQKLIAIRRLELNE